MKQNIEYLDVTYMWINNLCILIYSMDFDMQLRYPEAGIIFKSLELTSLVLKSN